MNENEARTELFSMFRNAWEADSQTTAGTATMPEVLWQGQTYNPPDMAKGPYAKASIYHRVGRQGSLGGADGKRRWVREGSIEIQCYCPLNYSVGNPLTISSSLGKIAKDAFEGRSSPGGIWFRDCRLNEMGPIDGWYQVNVTVDFTYDEVK